MRCGFNLSKVQNSKFKNVLHWVEHEIERAKMKKDQKHRILHEHITCYDTLKFEITNLRTSFINFLKFLKFWIYRRREILKLLTFLKSSRIILTVRCMFSWEKFRIAKYYLQKVPFWSFFRSKSQNVIPNKIEDAQSKHFIQYRLGEIQWFGIYRGRLLAARNFEREGT